MDGVEQGAGGGDAGEASVVAGSDAVEVTLKLYASLGTYLPAGAQRNQAVVKTGAGTTARALLDAHGVPPEACHLVLVNGIYQAPGQRTNTALKDGDTLAVWPPVAGG